MSNNELEKLADILGRRELTILIILYRAEKTDHLVCVGDLRKNTGWNYYMLRKTLLKLDKAGLIKSYRVGKFRIYRLTDKGFNFIKTLLFLSKMLK
ncbi:MAG TPA: transcriptional regulator [Thermoprotei archaeon]|nr:transcriptional regulator [Thermoprotei archaeon]